eukprot:4310880-Pleurochrysis_carterae.AAC.3
MTSDASSAGLPEQGGPEDVAASESHAVDSVAGKSVRGALLAGGGGIWTAVSAAVLAVPTVAGAPAASGAAAAAASSAASAAASASAYSAMPRAETDLSEALTLLRTLARRLDESSAALVLASSALPPVVALAPVDPPTPRHDWTEDDMLLVWYPPELSCVSASSLRLTPKRTVSRSTDEQRQQNGRVTERQSQDTACAMSGLDRHMSAEATPWMCVSMPPAHTVHGERSSSKYIRKTAGSQNATKTTRMRE